VLDSLGFARDFSDTLIKGGITNQDLSDLIDLVLNYGYNQKKLTEKADLTFKA
jgi:hypothetical protein